MLQSWTRKYRILKWRGVLIDRQLVSTPIRECLPPSAVSVCVCVCVQTSISIGVWDGVSCPWRDCSVCLRAYECVYNYFSSSGAPAFNWSMLYWQLGAAVRLAHWQTDGAGLQRESRRLVQPFLPLDLSSCLYAFMLQKGDMIMIHILNHDAYVIRKQ